jgi:hypothetical protein
LERESPSKSVAKRTLGSEATPVGAARGDGSAVGREEPGGSVGCFGGVGVGRRWCIDDSAEGAG